MIEAFSLVYKHLQLISASISYPCINGGRGVSIIPGVSREGRVDKLVRTGPLVSKQAHLLERKWGDGTWEGPIKVREQLAGRGGRGRRKHTGRNIRPLQT